MNPRSKSLTQAVCDTITASAAAPTMSVQSNATTCTNRFTVRLPPGTWSERLPDAEMNAPSTSLGLAVDQEALDRGQLVPEIRADRADRSAVPKAGADRVPT